MAETDIQLSLFTDKQVIAATGMPVDSLRRLITWGAVKPTQSGGGRGRVRLWTVFQALRICVTSELVAAGYSLQMAHTLAYCLPIGNLMLFFEPEFLARIARRGTSDDSFGMLHKLLTRKRQTKEWPGPGQYAYSQVLILEHRLVYCGSSEEDFELVAEIDAGRQRVIPFHDPVRQVDGDRDTEDAPTIDTASLLISRRHLSGKNLPVPKVEEAVIRTQKLDMIVARSVFSLNLSLSFVLCVRRLQGLETHFNPGYADEVDE